MRGCNTVCPKCKHEFACCPQGPTVATSYAGASLLCPGTRRSIVLSGGGLVGTSVGATLVPPVSPCSSPQISPGTSISFVLPVPVLASPPFQEAKPDAELQQLADTVRALRQSGWFYEDISFQESNDLLKDTKVGTFLVRNSSNPKFLFSLSVQTERGPTSVRLYYINGYFRLDSQPHLQHVLPAFPNVIDLIQHYVQEFIKNSQNAKDTQVWVDNQGQLYSSIRIKTPLRKRGEPPSLKHLARLSIHKAIYGSNKPKIALMLAPHKQLELPNSLVSYLSEYPHWV
ncbi:suppressor of cytokine signaling 2-like [Rhynchophorus ferrugineus]|uniref:Cytokine-inducible SH2-containing protein n=1 Tax=Rhynchophorus ferrugineus TaxID=354439 RepID=A0A834MJZ6_RHYFE|nr:hypothetical protein GWI33_003870 [Rhynchophorus ferrugineus]